MMNFGDVILRTLFPSFMAIQACRPSLHVVVERDFIHPRDQWVKTDISATIWSAGSGSRSRFKLIRISRVGLQG